MNPVPEPEAAPEATTSETTDDVTPEPVGDARPRNPDGTFAPTRTDEPEPDSEPEPILGKFKSTEDLIAAYQNLERQQGERGNELGDLRRQVDELNAYLQQQTQPAQQQVPDQATVEWIDQVAEQNPYGAAEWARQNAPALFDRVMESWFETNPRHAYHYEQQLRDQYNRAQLQQELQPALKPAQDIAQAQTFNRAWNAVAAQYPEINQHAEAIIEVASADPKVLQLIMSGDEHMTTIALENLAARALRRVEQGQADTVAQAAQQVAAEQRQESIAARQQATVATASAGVAPADKGALDRFTDSIVGAARDLSL